MADKDLRIRVILSKVGDLIAPLRGIGAQAAKTSAALKSTQAEVKALKRVQQDVATFRGLKTNLRSTSEELKNAQARVDFLAKRMAMTDKPAKSLAANFANAKKYAAALTTAVRDQSEQLQQVRARLSAAGVSTASLAAHERQLRGDLLRANTQLDAQKTKLGQLAVQERRAGAARRQLAQSQALASRLAVGGAATLGTGATILSPVAGSIREAGRFEAIMTSVAQKGYLSRVAATRMGAAIAAMAPKVNQLPEALAQGADVLAGFGLSAKQVPAVLLPVGRAATAYKAEIDDLSRASFAVVDNLKVPFTGTGRAIDIMAEAGKRGAFELKDMAQYFPELTASSAALGQRGAPAVADLAAALQIARKGSGDAATAANNLQNLLTKITAPATVKKFARMGVDLVGSLKKLEAEGRSPIEAISELTNKTLGGDLSKLGNLFEDMQVQQALRPLIAYLGLYREIRAAALKANGTVERDFAERMKDAEQQSQRLGVQTQALQIKLGTLLLPTVVALATRLNALVDRVSAWADRNPRAAKAAAIFAGALAVVLIVAGGLAIAIAGILGPLSLVRFALLGGLPALAAIGGLFTWLGGIVTVARSLLAGFIPVIWSFTAALLANPLTWIVLAIAGVVALAAAIYNHWGAIKAFVARVWQGLKTSVGDGLVWFVQLNLKFFAIGAQIVQGIIDGIANKLSALKGAIVGAAKAAAQWFRDHLGIRSPSRVFAGYGGNLMAGLANGIDDGRAAPLVRIQRLSRDLTAALAVGAALASPAAAGGGQGRNAPAGQAAAASGGNVYHFHIAQLPGENGDALARRIAAELDRRERSASAARRSTLDDYGD